MPKFQDQVYKKLPVVLVDIVRDYVKPEYELACLSEDIEIPVSVFVLGEVDRAVLAAMPGYFRLGIWGLRWIIYSGEKTITYDPKLNYFAIDDSIPDRKIIESVKDMKIHHGEIEDEPCHKCEETGEKICILDTNINCHRLAGIEYNGDSSDTCILYCLKCAEDMKLDTGEKFQIKLQHDSIIHMLQVSDLYVNNSYNVSYYRGFGRDKFSTLRTHFNIDDHHHIKRLKMFALCENTTPQQLLEHVLSN